MIPQLRLESRNDWKKWAQIKWDVSRVRELIMVYLLGEVIGILICGGGAGVSHPCVAFKERTRYSFIALDYDHQCFGMHVRDKNSQDETTSE